MFHLLNDSPFSHDLPVQSMVQVATTRVELPGPHIRQYRVFVVNMFPLGTSGVWVLQLTTTARLRSNDSTVAVTMHLVCLGPTGALSGLMYE